MGELSGNIKEFFWQLDELKQAFYHQREILAKIEIIYFLNFYKNSKAENCAHQIKNA